MGLDGVELIMAYEEAFGIQFTDEDAVRMRTPRDVIDLVALRVPTTNEKTCLEQRAFYSIRSSLRELTPVERQQLRPLTPLAHIFLLTPPTEIGRRLGDKLGLTSKLPVDRLSTIADLAVWLSENAVGTLKHGQPWSREEIARTVKQLTLAQLGDVPYGEDLRFVEDLGVD